LICTTSLNGTSGEALGKLGVGAIAFDVAVGATELGVGNADHVTNAFFTAIIEGVHVLGGNCGHEGRDGDDELHCEFWDMCRLD